MKYKVYIKEILEREVLIDATDEFDAISKVEERYDNEEEVLDYSDYSETTISCGRHEVKRYK